LQVLFPRSAAGRPSALHFPPVSGYSTEMTEKLYYHDPSLTEFRTRLLGQERIETGGGPRWRVLLEATCFYPGGGGQPSDRGTLNDRDVLEVLKEGDDVLHLLETPLEEDEEVHGRIDPLHRRHFMQQHTGQHILSAVLQHRCGYATRSVHLGDAASSIEIEGSAITPFEIIEVEDEANRIICENRPVHAFFVSPEELPSLELRRALKTDTDIRVVEISGLDQVGCGGVHLERTGGVRLVKHLSTEKVRGNSRLLFAVGDRAMADYREKSRISALLSTLLSAPVNEIPRRLEEYVEKNTEKERLIGLLLKERNSLLAAKLYRGGDSFSGGKIIAEELSVDHADSLREIAEAAVACGPGHVLLVIREESRLRWVLATSEPDPHFFARLKPVLLPLIDGKGGGRPPFWQGAGENPAALEEFLEAFRRLSAGSE
jgi:alanyl-tRNA synthetase